MKIIVIPVAGDCRKIKTIIKKEKIMKTLKNYQYFVMSEGFAITIKILCFSLLGFDASGYLKNLL